MKAKGTVSISLKMKVHPRQANKWGTWNTCDLSIQDDTMTQQPRDDRGLYKLEIIKTYSRLSKSFYTIYFLISIQK